MKRREIYRIKGIVQGVGFRPFLYRLAKERHLTGFVLNDVVAVIPANAATGDKGVIYKIAPDGKGDVFYRTKATNVVALGLDKAGNLVADLPLTEGAMYHPGGVDYDGRDIWVPLAEYRPDSHAIVYRVASYQSYLGSAPADDSLRFGARDGLARAQAGKGDVEGALKTYDKASEISFFKDRAALDRGRLLAKAGRKDDARKALDSVPKESPLRAEAQEQLAKLSADR